MVQAPPGQPYLDARTEPFEWTKGAVERRVDAALPRVTIRGKVTEVGTGKPVAGAGLASSANSSGASRSSSPFSFGWTGPDGSVPVRGGAPIGPS